VPLDENNSTDNLANLGEAERRLERISQLLAEIEGRQERVMRGVGREVRAAAADVQRLNRDIEKGTSEALAGLLSDTRKTRRALERIWEGFLQFFASRIVRGLSGALANILPSPGGLFGSLLGGLLGIFGLQEGGLVRGTRGGRLFVLGENFTDEVVVPLKELGLPAREAGAAPSIPGGAAEVNVYPQFVIENRTPLEADFEIYKLAERGRVRLTRRAAAPSPGVRWEE